MLILVGAAILVAVGSLILVNRNLLAPISTLTSHIEQLSRGKIGQRLLNQRSDELGRLTGVGDRAVRILAIGPFAAVAGSWFMSRIENLMIDAGAHGGREQPLVPAGVGAERWCHSFGCGQWFNLRRDKFQDPRVREAIALMFNFEWTNATLFHELYKRTDSFWENSPMQAEGLPQGEELAVLEQFRDQLPPEEAAPAGKAA